MPRFTFGMRSCILKFLLFLSSGKGEVLLFPFDFFSIIPT